jgi:peptidoglycan/LPS O-acetylase OafA/YrhL
VLLLLMLFVTLCRLGVWFIYNGELNDHSLYVFSRVDGLLVGAALAAYLQNHERISHKIIRNIFILVMMMNVIFLFINQLLQPKFPYLPMVGYITFSLLFGLIVYKVITMKPGYISLFLNLPLLRFLGKISYGLYIYHWPIYMLFYSAVKSYLQIYLPDSIAFVQILASCIITLLAAAVSVASYLFIEKRFLKLKTYFNGTTSTPGHLM